MKKIQFIFLNVIILSMVAFSNINAQSSVNDKESARIFVQKFYDWYNKLYNEQEPGAKKIVSAEDSALIKKANCFDASLREAIIKDNEAPSNTDGINSLDFDPILAAQDDGFDYQTGNVKQLGNKFFVDVHSALFGKSRIAILKEPTWVIPVVVKENGHWKFVNFIYPPPGATTKENLVAILKGLKNDRAKWAAEADKKKP